MAVMVPRFALAIISVVVATACAGNAGKAESEPAATPHVGPKLVGCEEAVGEGKRLRTERVVLGRVVLPPERFPYRPRYQPGHGPLPYFAKYGVLILSGPGAVDLLVPSRWRARFAIGWGIRGAEEVRRVRFVGCERAWRWRAYAGGYYLREPACVPLIVKVGGSVAQVRLGIGRRCEAPA